MPKKRDRKKTHIGSPPGGSRKSFTGLGAVLLLSILLVVAVAFGIVVSRSKRENIAATRSAALPVSTPEYAANKPAKEYIYAGGKLVAVSEPANYPTDLAIWRLSTGTWWVIDENGASTTQSFGLSTDLPAPADFDDDGKTDFCVYRPSEGYWYMLQSASNNTMAVYAFGINGDKPVPADYNGDGKAELAVFRASSNTWYLQDTV